MFIKDLILSFLFRQKSLKNLNNYNIFKYLILYVFVEIFVSGSFFIYKNLTVTQFFIYWIYNFCFLIIKILLLFSLVRNKNIIPLKNVIIPYIVIEFAVLAQSFFLNDTLIDKVINSLLIIYSIYYVYKYLIINNELKDISKKLLPVYIMVSNFLSKLIIYLIKIALSKVINL